MSRKTVRATVWCRSPGRPCSDRQRDDASASAPFPALGYVGKDGRGLSARADLLESRALTGRGRGAVLTLREGGRYRAHVALLFLRNPEWHAGGDMDGPQAVRTRRKLYDMVATDRILLAGYHLPFPAVGYIEKDGSSYRFVPAAWSPVL
jgi:hypothetical protein